MKKPDELADPKKLPADLKVLLQELKIQEDDPLFAVLAWHWLRINESRDILEDRTAKLTSALDERKGAIEEKAREIGALMTVRQQQLETWSQTLQEIFQHLENVNQVLSEKPLAISKHITEQLAHPIGQSVTLIQQLAAESKELVTDLSAARQRLHRSHLITAFLSGYATAALILSWMVFHFYSH
jgi:hypothetical protein